MALLFDMRLQDNDSIKAKELQNYKWQVLKMLYNSTLFISAEYLMSAQK